MHKKILIVEDEPGIVDTLHYALTTEGFETICCSTGAEALKSINESIQLILLDVGLPDTDGFELCKQIRKASDVPIIFLTAREDEIDRIVGLEIGADDYVTKPFSPRELTARVKAVLRRSTHQTAEKQLNSNSPFKIDDSRHVISYFGTPIELSRYEYRILEILIGRPGWVYSREKLMYLAWEEPDMSLERTIDSHIKNIRSKLRAIRPEISSINTHRGEGYSLKEQW